MRSTIIVVALLGAGILSIPQGVQAAQAVKIEAKCEVIEIRDESNVLEGKIALGDAMTAELETYLSTLPRQESIFGPALSRSLRLWNQNVTTEAPADQNYQVVSHRVTEEERDNGVCRNELSMFFSNDMIPSSNTPFAFPKLTVAWENSECYGEDQFERPQGVDLADWSMQTIRFYNELDINDLKTVSFTVRVLEYKVTETVGGVVFLRAFEDLNGNCLFDRGEKMLQPPGLIDVADPGNPIQFNTEGLGLLRTQENSLSLAVDNDAREYRLSCGTAAIRHDFTEGSADIVDIPLRKSFEPINNAFISVGADAALPGKPMQYRLFAMNTTDAPLSGEVQLEFNNLLSFVSARPAAGSQASDIAGWRFNDLAPGERFIIFVDMMLPNDPLLQGEALCVAATFTSLVPNFSETDNYCQTIVGKMDQILLSRLKRERDAAGSNSVEADEEMEFMLQINNSDARPVKSMRISVPFHQDFVAGSVAPLAASHPYSIVQGADGATDFVFDNVNLEPANADGLGGRAFLRLSAQLRQDLPEGHYLENYVKVKLEYAATADEERPAQELLSSNIVTSRVGAVVSSVEGQDDAKLSLRVFPNPSTERLNIEHPNLSGAKVQVHDQLGRGVMQLRAVGESLRIDTHSLAVGLYVVRIEFKSGGFETVRFGVVR